MTRWVVTLGISPSALLRGPRTGGAHPGALGASPACLRPPPCQDLKKYGATTVVRVCEVTYDKAPLEKDGITVVVRAPGSGSMGRGGAAGQGRPGL